MGYRIVYGKDKRRSWKLNKGKYTLIFAIAICIALMAVSYFCGDALKLPGESLENMAQAVQNGESLSDAITAFCREIIENAQIPE
ncbi:MAG: hypothetical protein IJZ15_05080 [Oscillospiraceae bacterium]|nr:hypothetical protein [Oscillospiraceae bacterium]